MPKYRFICSICNTEKELYALLKTDKVPCSVCGNDIQMERQLPNIGSKQVTEVVDSFTGVTNEEDQKLKTKSRRVEYFWEVEVPRLIQTYSLQTCLEEGWLVYNEKGELVPGKAPNKR